MQVPNMGKIGYYFEKMSNDHRVSTHRPVPWRWFYCTSRMTGCSFPCNVCYVFGGFVPSVFVGYFAGLFHLFTSRLFEMTINPYLCL